MQNIRNGYRGLSLLVDLNWDRFLSTGALALALLAGAWVATNLGYIPLIERI